LRFAKGTHEPPTLDASSPKQAPLGKNDGPGDHAKNQEQHQNDFCDRTGFPYKVNDLSTDEYSEK
jgi:hypothetical protein